MIMPILNKDQLLTKIKEKLGEDTSDEAISLIEDVNDTFDDLESKTKDSTDWKKKYEENDVAWRKKYTDRFYNGGSKEVETDKPDMGDEGDEVSPDQLTFENLFKEEK